MLNNPVLVLGSKPGSIVPNINFSKVYTANGAAERGMIYKQKFSKSNLSCCVAMREFLKNHLVKEKILASKPNRVIFRTFEKDLSNLFDNSCKIENLSWKQQFDLQSKYIKFGKLSLIVGESKRDNDFLIKTKYLFNCLRKMQFWGISTGFFAIILAHSENPQSDIVVSGIGMSGGVQFYQSERSKKYNYFPRARVDRFVARFIKDKIRNKIFSVDDDFVENTKTKKLII